MFTRDVRELVAHFDVVRLVGIPIVVVDVFVDPLASLGRSARGCHEVPAGVVRVYWAVVVVVGCAGQRVFVETRLVCRGPVGLVAGVADGELDVSLGSRFVRTGRGGRGLVFFFQETYAAQYDYRTLLGDDVMTLHEAS